MPNSRNLSENQSLSFTGSNHHKNSSLLSTIDSFSTKRPLAFLAMTLGLGILWYLAKLIYYAGRAILNALGAHSSSSINNTIEINCGPSSVNNTAGIANAINLDPNNSAVTTEPPLPPPPTPHLKTRRLAIPKPGASPSSPPSPSSSILRP